ncbi:MAG: NAD-dependent deacylase [Thermoplasmatales archaeon]|nr:MAG: NAD-dependent deacylase [Thermoplasmatales archaeon]
MEEVINKLKDIIADSKHLVAFTGAGLSAESGIPTYRGAGGLWTTYDPMKYANIHFFLEDPTYYWSFFRDVRYPIIKKAKPNPAHYALVELEKQGKLSQVITQNIDGLHQIAGQSNVIELHGNTRQIVCMECKWLFSMETVYKRLEQEFPPNCPRCKGLLKPDTVFFGESLPQKALNEAMHAAQNCDLFLVVGSSLVVSPAAQLPRIAKENGASLVIVNIDITPLDGIAELVIHEQASQVLSVIIQRDESQGWAL